MTEVTLDQLRQIRSVLQNTARELNKFASKNNDNLSDEQFNNISLAIGKLLDASASLTAQAIKGTADEIASSVQGIQSATDNANGALRMLNNIKKGIEIATVLVGLGAAIATGNPAGIAQASVDVIATARAAIT
jgi:prefoldin subunit 5